MTDPEFLARIKVVGLGGAGVNAINRMIQVGIPGVDFIAANTDAQSLLRAEPCARLQLGTALTRGLGAGGHWETGAKAAQEVEPELKRLLAGAHLVFLAAGMGGGTGTGAAPVVARIAREMGALTVAVVTRPFSFEGQRRQSAAEEGIARLRDQADTIIVVSNDRLLKLVQDRVTLDVAFRVADDVLRQGVQGISELITRASLINLDLADLRAVMAHGGNALLAIGEGHGDSKVIDAVNAAVKSPLISVESLEGAAGLVIHITGGSDLTLNEVQDGIQMLSALARAEANIQFGASIDPAMTGRAQVILVATGVGQPRSEVIRVGNTPIVVNRVAERLPTPDVRMAESARQAVRQDHTQQAQDHDDNQQSDELATARLRANDLDVPAFLRRRVQSIRARAG
jgi:cell division protein FtsZ